MSDKWSWDPLCEGNVPDQNPVSLKEPSNNDNEHLKFLSDQNINKDIVLGWQWFSESSVHHKEWLCKITKPCLTNKDFQSLPDLNQIMDPDLPQISIIKVDKFEEKSSFKFQDSNEKIIKIQNEEDTLQTSNNHAVILKLGDDSSNQIIEKKSPQDQKSKLI